MTRAFEGNRLGCALSLARSDASACTSCRLVACRAICMCLARCLCVALSPSLLRACFVRSSWGGRGRLLLGCWLPLCHYSLTSSSLRQVTTPPTHTHTHPSQPVQYMRFDKEAAATGGDDERMREKKRGDTQPQPSRLAARPARRQPHAMRRHRARQFANMYRINTAIALARSTLLSLTPSRPRCMLLTRCSPFPLPSPPLLSLC